MQNSERDVAQGKEKMKVYLTEHIHPEAEKRLSAHVDLDVGETSTPKSTLIKRIAEIDVLFNKTDPVVVDRQLIDAAKNLKYIARHGSGYSNVDVSYATEKGILVSNTPGVNAVSIGEYTIALMIMIARKIFPAATASCRGNPERLDFMGMELLGKVIGIIGVGHIGREVVRRAQAFGMQVLAYHPRPSARKLTDLDLKLVDLETLLKQSDVVSIHAPLTQETRGLIGERELALMKRSSYLINMGRGGMVDEAALERALRSGSIAGAALDVLEEEPVQRDHPLLTLENALVLPHIGSLTHESQRRTAMTAVEDILRFDRGEKPKHLVNPEVFESQKEKGKETK
jgi:D-3-phosphoglycerate dehydrogenase